ncbi:hypothetical protein M408DRAFT_194109 [Serendipita vermifera MAFF 305830]|uniref:Peptidase C14 caspase domain-containing protein n=1 Tax=Serendipita vermifera MAFF 305830 TaxID=933852 RepID=A0A0C3B222_SERVB|nr:hypothetical protein M408DRAFT_194109 [Serendipita vermifera MAFF 305830]
MSEQPHTVRLVPPESMNNSASDSIPDHIKVPNLRALLIGIDRYAAPGIVQLDGAVADAEDVKSYLKNYLAVPELQIKTLYDTEATRWAIIKAIEDLGSKANLMEENAPLLIYFAGHGGEGKRPNRQGPDQTIQMILPQDFKQPLGDSTVQGVLDYEFNELLKQLSISRGNNITVILDCCYSGSGTRDASDIRKVRSAKIEKVIPDIRKGTRGCEIAKGFLHTGLRSHVLLAACNENEKAREDGGRGEFTKRLIQTFVETGGRVTYHDLLLKLGHIRGQNPQCEGYYKTRFLWDCMAIGFPHFNVRWEDKYLILEAGFVHGITENTHFTIYQGIDDYPSNPQRILVVQSAGPITSILEPPSGLSTVNTTDTQIRLKPQAFAVLRKVGNEEDFPLHIEDAELHQFVKDTLEKAQRAPLPHRDPRTIVFVDKQTAQLALSIDQCDQAFFTFEILNPSVTAFGLRHIPFRVKRGDLESVIQCAAHFDWHLRRAVSKEKPIFHESVRLEFTKVFKRDRRVESDNSNLNVDNRIKIVVGQDKYGIKLINNSAKNIYPYLFFFDCSDLSIECYYDSATEIVSGKAPLRAKSGVLTIGYDASGWAPWSYSLRQPESIGNGRILQDEQEVDVGFLKLFLSSDPLNLSHMVQYSPFKPPFRPGHRGVTRHPYEALEFCETRIIEVIQRKEFPEDQGESRPRGLWPNTWKFFG